MWGLRVTICHGEKNVVLIYKVNDVRRVEKYRPATLDDVVSHKDITSTSMFSYLKPDELKL